MKKISRFIHEKIVSVCSNNVLIFIQFKDWAEDELPPINSPWNTKIISEKVNLLKKLAVFLRSKREENGALRLDQPKVCFSLDKESGMPQGYKLYEQRASNKLIEEFMLLANISVATKIENVFPNLALLRCHPDPKETLLEKSVDQLKKYGNEIIIIIIIGL